MLTLDDVSRATLYFSDRPERVVGHVTWEMFVDTWDEGENSFSEDPPNAVLAFLEPATKHPVHIVTVIETPRMNRSSLSNDNRGARRHMRADAKRGVTLFIDSFGRPLSPVSAAGVHRRRRHRLRRGAL